jgi:predicted N-acetyltransferase YhbS
MGTIDQLTLDDYQMVESINARAVWQCERAQIAQMLTQDPLSTQ